MSDTENTTTEAAEAVEDTTPETVEGTTGPDEDTAEPDSNKEAAKYRRKLREAEKQRDELAARVEALQRAQAEGLLAASGVKPQAVFAVAELADLLGDDGTIDADKLTAAVETAREKFGIAKPTKGNLVPGVGSQPNRVPKADAWREAFTPSRKR